jgi:hypothetical protein
MSEYVSSSKRLIFDAKILTGFLLAIGISSTQTLKYFSLS